MIALALLIAAGLSFAMLRRPKRRCVVIGRSKHGVITIPYRQRAKGVYIVGGSGSGKTTTGKVIAEQDMRQSGVCFIDPHGDAAADLVARIPRVSDCIYFFPARLPVPMNIMYAENEFEAEIIASDIITIFKRLSDSWGPRMDAILRYSVYALVRYPGACFLDIHKLLTDDTFRRQVATRSESEIQRFLLQELPGFPENATAPITYRLSQFMLSPTLRSILGNPNSRLNLYEAMNSRKIIIVNLSGLGAENQRLLGSIFVSQIQLAAMRRSRIPKSKRVPFYLFVDEFQNFTSSAFETILCEARKYKLCLTLIHQHPTQIDTGTLRAVINNVQTAIMFNVKDPAEERLLRGLLGSLEPDYLMRQKPHHALLYSCGNTFPFRADNEPRPRKDTTGAVLESTHRCTVMSITT